MGGLGSGRRFGGPCTGDFLSIDVRQWQREGFLQEGISFTLSWQGTGKVGVSVVDFANCEQVRLSYTLQNEGNPEHLSYPVQLTSTPCHFGGERFWFLCRVQGCGRTAALLYLGDKYFACRHCHRLAYQSQRETEGDRMARKANTIRRQLGWKVGILNPEGDKPKGMHWKRFYRLRDEQDELAYNCMYRIACRFKIKIDK